MQRIDGALIESEVRYGYNRRFYTVTLVEGEWPSDDALLRAFGADEYCGWGNVSTTTDSTKILDIWGCD